MRLTFCFITVITGEQLQNEGMSKINENPKKTNELINTTVTDKGVFLEGMVLELEVY